MKFTGLLAVVKVNFFFRQQECKHRFFVTSIDKNDV